MNSPFILLSDVVLLRQVDQVDDWLGSDKQAFIQNLNLIVIPLLKSHRTFLYIQHLSHSQQSILQNDENSQQTLPLFTPLSQVVLS